MRFEYDKSADVLYVTLDDRPPERCRFFENKNGDVVKVDAETDEVVGATIISFLLRIKKGIDVDVPEIGPCPFKKQAKQIMRGMKRRA